MSNSRKSFSDIEKNILYNEVDGICPLCQQKLHNYKDGAERKMYQIAHIYPLNPPLAEKNLLKNEERLSTNTNDLKNLIALCPNCHITYDNPATIESYRKLFEIKKKIIENKQIVDIYSEYTIEEDIINIISNMNINLSTEQEKIEYNLLKVDQKIDSDNKLLINKVKNDVTDYYIMIKNLFAEMDKNNFGFFNNVAGQIKSFYIKLSSMSSNQDEIYEHIAKWLQGKMNYGSIEAYRIIVSFFIQNCEVFKDVSK